MTTQAERPSATFSFGAAMAGEPCTVHGLADVPHPLPMRRWAGLADASDEAVLAHCRGPVLDVGCGPGRMSGAPGGARRARCSASTSSPRRSPRPGRAGPARCTVTCSTRCPVTAPGPACCSPTATSASAATRSGCCAGCVVCSPPTAGSSSTSHCPAPGTRAHMLELECGGRRSAPFPWTVAGHRVPPGVAAAAGLRVDAVHDHDGRWFAVLGVAGRRR